MPLEPTSLTIDAWTFDVGAGATTVADYVEACASRVEQSWETGADIVLLPEYAWAGLEPVLGGDMGLRGVAGCFWTEVLPGLAQRLARPGKLAVLGTAPFVEPGGTMLNRAAILDGGRLLMQDKLYLTPWESEFQQGQELRVFEFRGLRVSVLICLDIEVPELSAMLRGQNVDLILVPSATETLMGCERVTRCASARAVELCCAVVVTPLVGRCTSALVDENLGKSACYLPSQAAFAGGPRVIDGPVRKEGFHCARFFLACELLRASRCAVPETNPAALGLGSTKPRLVIH